MPLTEKQKWTCIYIILFSLISCLCVYTIFNATPKIDINIIYLLLGISMTTVIASIVLYFSTGIVLVPQQGFIRPDLHRLVFVGKYSIPKKTIDKICSEVSKFLNSSYPVTIDYLVVQLPRGAEFTKNVTRLSKLKSKDHFEIYVDGLKRTRSGFPISLKFNIIDENENSYIIESSCVPAMYRKISQDIEWQYMEHHIEDAEIQCRDFTRSLFIGVLGGKELEEPSARPRISKSEIKSRLIFMERNDISSRLDDAERDLDEDKYPNSVGNMRTALDLMISFYMEKKSLELTDGVKNNIQRLIKHGYLDEIHLTLLYNVMYSSMSEIAKGRRKTMKNETRLLLNLTVTAIEYMLDRI